MKDVPVVIEYSGGLAERGYLPAYDVGISITGISRALGITANAIAYEGHIRSSAARVRGVEIFVQPPRRGSFIQTFQIVFADPLVQAIGAGIVAAAFWDLIKWSWSAAIDRATSPQTDYIRALLQRKEPYISDVPLALESALEQTHHPIRRDDKIEISVQQSPGNIELVRFDRESLDYVSTAVLEDQPIVISGNVTRYNILSGFGRFYTHQEGRVVPFQISRSLPDRQKGYLTWSLDERNHERGGLLKLEVVRVVSARGTTKRYQVRSVERQSHG